MMPGYHVDRLWRRTERFKLDEIEAAYQRVGVLKVAITP